MPRGGCESVRAESSCRATRAGRECGDSKFQRFWNTLSGACSRMCVELLPFSDGINRAYWGDRCFLNVKYHGTFQKNRHWPGQGGFFVLQQNIGACLQRSRLQRFLLVFALLPALAGLNSCGGGKTTSASTTPTITASCASSTVTVNGQVQCTANITNLSSTLVNWQVSGTGTGTIDSNGLYKAPATVPSNNVVTITAVAQAQTSLTATATITIQQPTTINAVVCSGSTQTSSLTVASGMSLACTATSSANTPIPVFWQVNTITGGIATIGLMSPQGVYVAPLVPPAGGTVTITAVSQAVSTQTLSVPVAVTFGHRVLKGSYAFSTGGRLTATNGFFARAGSFVADGNGGVEGGLGGVDLSGREE